VDFPANHVSLPEAAQELGLTSDAGGVQGHEWMGMEMVVGR
jgi:hypothetical protein